MSPASEVPNSGRHLDTEMENWSVAIGPWALNDVDQVDSKDDMWGRLRSNAFPSNFCRLVVPTKLKLDLSVLDKQKPGKVRVRVKKMVDGNMQNDKGPKIR